MLPLDFVEVCVDFVAKVEVGLVLIERKGLQLLVLPGVALGSGPLLLGFGVVGLIGVTLRLGGRNRYRQHSSSRRQRAKDPRHSKPPAVELRC